MKGFVELILEEAGITDVDYCASSVPWLAVGQQAEIRKGTVRLGTVGVASSSLCSRFKLPLFSHVFELNLDALFSLSTDTQRYQALPRFPAIKRDISIVVPDDISAADIQRYILKASEHVEAVEFFDVYRGEHIPQGCRGLSVSLVFQHQARTLTDEEVNHARDRLVSSLQKKWHIVLRER